MSEFHQETSLQSVEDPEQTVWLAGAIDFTDGKASAQLSLYRKGLHKDSPVLLHWGTIFYVKLNGEVVNLTRNRVNTDLQRLKFQPI